MSEIKCSRCGCVKDVPDGWTYRECVSCHMRTTERFSKKTFKEKLLEDLNPQVTYEQAKREKLVGNLLSEPSKEEQLPQSKPKDYHEEWQKSTYEQQTKEAMEKQKQQLEPNEEKKG